MASKYFNEEQYSLIKSLAEQGLTAKEVFLRLGHTEEEMLNEAHHPSNVYAAVCFQIRKLKQRTLRKVNIKTASATIDAMQSMTDLCVGMSGWDKKLQKQYDEAVEPKMKVAWADRINTSYRNFVDLLKTSGSPVGSGTTNILQMFKEAHFERKEDKQWNKVPT